VLGNVFKWLCDNNFVKNDNLDFLQLSLSCILINLEQTTLCWRLKQRETENSFNQKETQINSLMMTRRKLTTLLLLHCFLMVSEIVGA